MGWFENDDNVPVEIPCRCPEKDGERPHEKDTVWLYPHLTVEGGLAGQMVWDELQDGRFPSVDVLIAKLGASFLQHGIASWTFLVLDANGNYERAPVTPQNVARFSRHWESARPVAEVANDLYGNELTAPLVERLSKSLRPGRTGGSTSRSRSSSSKPRKPSRRSTTATTRPLRVVTTSSDGDSNSLPKKRSASA